MKRTFLKFAAVSLASLVLAGCASGVKHKDMLSAMPSMGPGQGRIYFFRSNSFVGAALQPEIRLNAEAVGKSMPGGFFYVDRPAGKYVAAASTETEKTLTFDLAAGETKYVRSSTSFGIVVGRVILDLETAAKANEELGDLSYTGPLAAR
jgi:hypothetical protein